MNDDGATSEAERELGWALGQGCVVAMGLFLGLLAVLIDGFLALVRILVGGING